MSDRLLVDVPSAADRYLLHSTMDCTEGKAITSPPRQLRGWHWANFPSYLYAITDAGAITCSFSFTLKEATSSRKHQPMAVNSDEQWAPAGGIGFVGIPQNNIV